MTAKVFGESVRLLVDAIMSVLKLAARVGVMLVQSVLKPQ